MSVTMRKDGRSFVTVVIGGDFWEGFSGETNIYHFQSARAGCDPSDPFSPLGVITNVRQLLAFSHSVRQDGRVLSGTIDVAHVSPMDSSVKRVVSAMGPKASALPFTTGVDAQGRLSTFETTYEGAWDGKDELFSMHLSGFGATTSVERPVGAIVKEATPELYNTIFGV